MPRRQPLLAREGEREREERERKREREREREREKRERERRERSSLPGGQPFLARHLENNAIYGRAKPSVSRNFEHLFTKALVLAYEALSY